MRRIPIGGTFDTDKLIAELHAIPALRPKPHPDPLIGTVAQVNISGTDLCLPDDVDLREVARIVATHDGQPRERPKSRKDRARDALATIDGTKLTGENKKLLAVLRELVDD